MKKLKILSAFAILTLMLSACEYDNYEPPKAMLSGTLVFEEKPVGVKQNGNMLQLYEPGWQNFEPINVHVKQDGTFSALLFSGDYKLVFTPGNGPWVDQTDTIDVHVDGPTEITVPVEPFFWISNENFQMDGATLTAIFELDKIVEDSELQYVSLFIGETMLVDNRFNIDEKRIPANTIGDISVPITLSMDLTNIDEDFVFVRIGVKAQGSSELLFTPVQKIQL